MNDLKSALRQLLKNPGFTAVAVLTLALGIGANTAIFQLVDAIRLRTLPVRKPQELALIQIADMNGARGNFNSGYPSVTNPLWEHIRDQQQAFSGTVAWNSDGFNLSSAGEPRYANGLWVSGNFFSVLGIESVLGRAFTPADDQRGSAAAAVISFAFWQREFGGDLAVIGRKLSLDGHPVEVIGVTPAGFSGLEIGRSFDVAVPIAAEALLRGANNRLEAGTTWWLTVMGRLKPGSSLEQATTHLSSISRGIFETTLPANYPAINVTNYLGFKLIASPTGTGVSTLREQYTRPLWLLFSISGLVLLIACANLANLLLARAGAREKEIAVRLALGASRVRLVRQLMSENLLLTSVGAGLGWLIARILSQSLVQFLGVSVALDLDWRVFGFTTGLAVVTCVLFGLAPALRGTRGSPTVALKAGGRGLTASRERFGLRQALVISQVAISLVLLAGALLFSRSLRNLLTIDTGFQQNNILIAHVDLSRLKLPVERRQEFKRGLIERLQQIPGVDSATDTMVVPLSGNSRNNRVWMEGSPGEQATDVFISQIGADYFRTLKTPLLAGREFESHDLPASTKVAIVNESFMRRLANGKNPVGQRLRIEATPNEPESVYEIVGLVRDTKYQDLREDFVPIAFLASSQDPSPWEFDHVLIRSETPLVQIVPTLKKTIGDVHPEILATFRVLGTEIRSSLLRERLMATLSGFFGVLALLLACIGLYGILSYGVVSRTNEIGIRMAIGAERGDILRLVLREALFLVLIGVAIGLPLVLATKRLLAGLLFGLDSADPASVSVAVAMMLVVAVAAAWLPARRATKGRSHGRLKERMNPMRNLERGVRNERRN